jgi:thiol-disulfide isomerase/thioredoxin
MKKEIWWVTIVGLLFALIGGYAGVKKWEPAEPSPTAHHYFFSQSLPDINDKNEKMSNWHGKLLLVNFWATWCAPCVEEMPELSELQNERVPANLQVIGMGGIDLARQMGNQQGGLPFTVLFGPDGQVKKTYIGRLDMRAVRKDLDLFS